MTDWLQPYMHWLQTHPSLAGFCIFLIAFSESLAIIGSIVPGSVTMTAVGTLIGAGIFPFWSSMAWASLGAIVGDSCSYWLGFHFAPRIRTMWPFSQYPEWLLRGEAYFDKHGGKSVFFGRFIGPLRAIVPVVAGMMHMPTREFVVANVTSALLWAPCYMLPGIIVGAASEALEPRLFSALIVWVLVLITLIWVTYRCLHALMGLMAKQVRFRLLQLWRRYQHHEVLKRLANFVAPQPHSASHLQLNRLFLAFVCGVSFLSLALLVHGRQSEAIAINQMTYHLMRSIHVPLLHDSMVRLTLFAAGKETFMFLLATLTLWFCGLRQWRAAGHWFLFGVLSLTSTAFFKMLIQSVRPQGLHNTPLGWSFPSGHTELSVSFFGFLAILIAARHRRATRYRIYSLTGVLCGLIALSRIYLGAHWLTDIIGGALLGLFWVLLFNLSYRRASHTGIHPLPTLVMAMVTLSYAWMWQLHTNYAAAMKAYERVWPVAALQDQAWWQDKQKDVPLYRDNYIGHPTQVLNIQWGHVHLAEITAALINRGWKVEPLFSFQRLLRRITRTEIDPPNYHLPLMPRFYQDRTAAVTLVYQPQPDSHFFILRLWPSGFEIQAAPHAKPLWIGTLYWYAPKKKRWLGEKGALKVVATPDLVNVAEDDFKGLPYRVIHKCHTQKVKRLPQCADVLLIKGRL